MKLAQTFQAVEETQFLKQLSLQKHLFFIGETEILEYIKVFVQNSKKNDSNYYYDLPKNDLDELFTAKNNLDQYQAVVVASFTDESSLFLTIEHKAVEHRVNVPILRLFADVFINLMCQQDLLQSTSDLLIKPQKSYAIVTTPRSGSTYLCDLLESTKIAGYPTEHLRLAVQELTCNCNFDYLRLLHNLMQNRTTNNGVFGTKLISHFLFQLRQTKHDFRKIFNPINKFIFLSRRGKVAQAVSLVIAQKTEVWHLIKNAANNEVDHHSYQSKIDKINIDDTLLAEVKKKHQFLVNQETHLNKILLAHKIEPLQVFYEDVVETPELQVDNILNFLEIARPAHLKINCSSKIKKMPSAISQKIIYQYERGTASD